MLSQPTTQSYLLLAQTAEAKNPRKAMEYYFEAYSISRNNLASNKLGFTPFPFEKINPDQELAAEKSVKPADDLFIDGLELFNTNPQLGFCHLKAAADKGNAKAQWLMGQFYLKFADNYKDQADKYNEKGFLYFSLGAKQNYANALVGLGFCHDHNRGVNGDRKQAGECYQLAKEQGNAIAQYNLAFYIRRSNVVNLTLAVELCKMAAAQEYAPAEYELGICYYQSIGIPKDLTIAVSYFLKAAQQDYADAENYLGVCYKSGHGVEQNLEKAFEWFEKAAKQGNLFAQDNVAWCYHEGKGVKQNLEKAFEWFEKAAKQGNAEAQNSLGFCYRLGKRVEQNLKKAFEWFEKAAELGNAHALNNLGICYQNGEGVKQDWNKAFSWYRKAGEQENAHDNALLNLGICYERGIGTEINWELAAKFFKLSAAQGNKEAQEKIDLDQHSYAAAQNLKRFKQLQQNAELNNPQAQYDLGNSYAMADRTEQDWEKAIKYYNLAATKDHPKAQIALGNCYRWGNGVDKNLKTAIEWYEKAAAKGRFVEAILALMDIYLDRLNEGLKNFAEALKLHKKHELVPLENLGLAFLEFAAENNELEIQVYLATHYSRQKTDEAELKAVKYWQMAAQQNNSEAQFQLGQYYASNDRWEEAVPNFKLAAKNNHSLAQQKYSDCFEKGLGVPQNLKKALKWHNKAITNGANRKYSQILLEFAANQDDANAQDILGKRHLKKQKYNLALELFKKAASKNHAGAQNNLGYCYEHGLGTSIDLSMAFDYYKKSAFQDHDIGQFNLGICYEEGINVAKHLQNAIFWYKQAAMKQNKRANVKLGGYYLLGIGVEKDLTLSSFHYMQLDANKLYDISCKFMESADHDSAKFILMLAANQGSPLAKITIPHYDFLIDFDAILADFNSNREKLTKYLQDIKESSSPTEHPLIVVLRNGVRDINNPEIKLLIEKTIFKKILSANLQFPEAVKLFEIVPHDSILYVFGLYELANLESKVLLLTNDEKARNGIQKEILSLHDEIKEKLEEESMETDNEPYEQECLKELGLSFDELRKSNTLAYTKLTSSQIQDDRKSPPYSSGSSANSSVFFKTGEIVKDKEDNSQIRSEVNRSSSDDQIQQFNVG